LELIYPSLPLVVKGENGKQPFTGGVGVARFRHSGGGGSANL
jgi:hypothetical protein